MTDCPECNCADTAEIVALKEQAANMKATILARRVELMKTIDALKAELAALQQKNVEYLRPRADICVGTVNPQSLNVIKTYRFGSKCGER
jgi:hypothetical protein